MKDFFILFFFNFLFYFFFIVFSIFGIPLFSLIVAIQALFISHRKAMGKFRRAVAWYGIVVCKVLPFPFVRIFYKDVDTSTNPGPFIFICNHRSASDPFLMAYLPAKEVIQVVNIWPFKIPILGFMAKSAGYLSVREMDFEDFEKKTIELLNQGVSIAVFPEGTRSKDGSSVGQFHSSMFRVALKSGYPIVPVCITGNEKIPARGTLILRPGVIKIHKLKTIIYDEYKNYSPFKFKNRVRQIIIDEIKIMESKKDG